MDRQTDGQTDRQTGRQAGTYWFWNGYTPGPGLSDVEWFGLWKMKVSIQLRYMYTHEQRDTTYMYQSVQNVHA